MLHFALVRIRIVVLKKFLCLEIQTPIKHYLYAYNAHYTKIIFIISNNVLQFFSDPQTI